MKSLKEFNWSLFISLMLLSFTPTIYQTVRTFLIAVNENQVVFDIIGQMEWFDLINESINAFLIVPLYSVFNRIKNNSQDNFKNKVFKYGLLVFGLYSLFQIFIFIHGTNLVSYMTTGNVDQSSTIRYLMLETLAFSIGIIISYINVVFVIIGKPKNIYIYLIISSIMTMISDFVMIPNFGIYGIAYSNILVNLIISALLIIVLRRSGYLNYVWFSKDDKDDLKFWANRGLCSGLQIVIANVVYAVMVVKMINMVSNQGVYWLANNFIWGWLLIPTYALAEVIKRDTAVGYSKLNQKPYYLILGMVVVVWLVTIPFWNSFFTKVQGIENGLDVVNVVLKLLPFYIVFLFNTVPDSIFIGLGKTNYLLVNAMIVNFVYYGIFYYLYRTGIIIMSLDMIIIMFGLGVVLASIVKWIIEFIFLRKKLKKVV